MPDPRPDQTAERLAKRFSLLLQAVTLPVPRVRPAVSVSRTVTEGGCQVIVLTFPPARYVQGRTAYGYGDTVTLGDRVEVVWVSKRGVRSPHTRTGTLRDFACDEEDRWHAFLYARPEWGKKATSGEWSVMLENEHGRHEFKRL